MIFRLIFFVYDIVFFDEDILLPAMLTIHFSTPPRFFFFCRHQQAQRHRSLIFRSCEFAPSATGARVVLASARCSSQMPRRHAQPSSLFTHRRSSFVTDAPLILSHYACLLHADHRASTAAAMRAYDAIC
jgi:hypothetical protein